MPHTGVEEYKEDGAKYHTCLVCVQSFYSKDSVKWNSQIDKAGLRSQERSLPGNPAQGL